MERNPSPQLIPSNVKGQPSRNYQWFWAKTAIHDLETLRLADKLQADLKWKSTPLNVSSLPDFLAMLWLLNKLLPIKHMTPCCLKKQAPFIFVTKRDFINI